MNKLRITSLLTLLAGATAGLVYAHGNESGAKADGSACGHRHRHQSLIKAALDANKDHVIDASEIAGASAALKTLDLNRDGMLTADEIRPPRPQRAEANGSAAQGSTPEGEHRDWKNGKQHRISPLVAALDANHDGIIDANEIANASRTLAQLDKNGDGKLTREDLHRDRGEPQANGENHAPAN